MKVKGQGIEWARIHEQWRLLCAERGGEIMNEDVVAKAAVSAAAAAAAAVNRVIQQQQQSLL